METKEIIWRMELAELEQKEETKKQRRVDKRQKRQYRLDRAKEKQRVKEYRKTPRGYFSMKLSDAIKRNKAGSNLTLVELLDVWDGQEGKCALTGLKLETSQFGTLKASIDRIDSKKGYTKDNIQIICAPLNMMKGILTNSEFLSWCRLVAKKNPR